MAKKKLKAQRETNSPRMGMRADADQVEREWDDLQDIGGEPEKWWVDSLALFSDVLIVTARTMHEPGEKRATFHLYLPVMFEAGQVASKFRQQQIADRKPKPASRY